MKPSERIIVAIDPRTKRRPTHTVFQEARSTIMDLGCVATTFKIGLGLFPFLGNLINDLSVRGLRIFVDLKAYDIPWTVERTVELAASLKVDFLTLRYGKADMMRAATGVKRGDLKLLCVPYLTTEKHTEGQAEYKARSIVEDYGFDGIVCPGSDVRAIRRAARKTIIICPGVHLPGEDKRGHRFTVTPKTAMKNGADYLVVGRPITQSDDMVAAFKRFADNIQEEKGETR